MKSKPSNCLGCPLYTVNHFDVNTRQLITNVGKGWVDSQGEPYLGLTLVGDNVGQKEEITGLPFRSDAQAGAILERVFRRVGIDRKQVKLDNIVRCRPPNNELSGKPYEGQAITHCSPNIRQSLLESLAYVRGSNTAKQHVTVALGDTAFRSLTGLAGDKLSISRTRGYPIITPDYGLVMGTYHPTRIAQKRKFMGVLIEDVLTAMRWARQGFTKYPIKYNTHPTDADKQAMLFALRSNPNLMLTWDIESHDIDFENSRVGIWPTITSFQFSIKPGEGMFIEYTPENIEFIRAMLATSNPKLGHNIWDFDCQVVRFWGYHLNGDLHDSLWMFHHYQPDITVEDMAGDAESDDDFRLSTSAGLQYVASFCGMDFIWKHENQSDPRHYGIADVDACSRIWHTLPQKMKNLGVWDGYLRHVYMMKPILDKAAKRGLWLDLDGRDSLHKELNGIIIDLDRVMQRSHPDQLKKLDPINGYVRLPVVGDKIRWEPHDPCGATIGFGPVVPGRGFGSYEWLDEDVEVEDDGNVDPSMPQVTGVWRQMVNRPFKVTKKEKIVCDCKFEVPGEPRVGKKGQPLKAKPKVMFIANCPRCAGIGWYLKLDEVIEYRWAKLKPFKTSNKQLINYIKFKGHKVPFDRKTGKNTTNRTKIEELANATKDPIYQTILDIRTVSKMDSTYVTGRWIPTKTWVSNYDGTEKNVGLIQTHFTTAPATGQKSSRDPNIQNAPKHTRNANLRDLNLPKRFRKLLIAPPNHQIVEFDYKSAHALTLGFEAECEDYMRLARIDVHTYMASVILNSRGITPSVIDLNVADSDLKVALKTLRATNFVKKDNIWQPATADINKAYAKTNDKGDITGYSSIPFVIAGEVRDTQAKPSILGYGFGLKGLKLWEMNKESFANQFEAQGVLDLIDIAFPPLKTYRDNQAMLAHDQHYLVTRAGAVRWFWDVFSFKYNPNDPKKWKTSHGSDYEDAIALAPANDAFGHIDEAMITLEETGLNDEYNFVNTVHDSLIFFVHDGIFDIALTNVRNVMEAPSKVLINRVAPTGLVIGVDVMAGRTWGELKEVK